VDAWFEEGLHEVGRVGRVGGERREVNRLRGRAEVVAGWVCCCRMEVASVYEEFCNRVDVFPR
jgi:hypothetical protein